MPVSGISPHLFPKNSIINSYHPHFRTIQLRLPIPQLTYEGKYYWADLQLDSLPEGALVLKVLNYGEVTRPVTDFSSCQEVILSHNCRW